MFNRRLLLVPGLILAMAASPSVWAQQFARPDSTTTPGTWTAVNAATHHEALNEASFDDNDYIDSGAGNTSTITLTLSNVSDPGGANANDHIMRFRCFASGSGGKERCEAALYEGNTAIATSGTVNADRNGFTLHEFPIPDASAISDYSNLNVRLTSSSLGGSEWMRISWFELEVPASATSAPSVTTIAATGVTNNQATLGGNVSSDGSDALTDVGVYYSSSSGFTPPGQGTQLSMTIQPVPGDFSGDLSGLPSGTTYYYLAYATNSIGETIAANEIPFTTKDIPTLLADPTATNIQATSATLGGTMTADGLDGITDCGVTWGTTSGAGPYTDNASVGVCTADNAFTIDTSTAGPLTTGTTYYFRSYASNSVGTAYSANEGSFKPVDTPQVTGTVGTLTDTTAVLGGDITDTGGDTITAVGIIWDVDSDPIDGGTDVPMTVADPFSQTVSGLPAGTPFWFVAYASNGAGPGYSSVVPFVTLPGAPTMNSTPTVTNIVGDGATLGGTLSSDGGGTITGCGVEWDTISGGPSYGFSQSFGACSAGTPFTVNVSGLTSGLTYYFRAYAASAEGTAYTVEDSFIPQAVPLVTSLVQLNETHNSADLGGDVTSDEGSPVSDRGIVWDTVASPELQPTKTVVSMGSGTGTFSQTVSLPSGQTIFFEAYASNSAGTAYSDLNRSFATGTEPTVQASNIVIESIYGRSIRLSWTRGNGDGSIVVFRADSTTIDLPADGTDYIADPEFGQGPETSASSGNFVVYKGSNNAILINGLNLTTLYHFAVYEYAGTGAATDYLEDTPATDSATTTDTPVHNYDNRVNCDSCHNHGSWMPRAAELETACRTCHTDGQVAANKQEFSNHLGPSNPEVDYVDCGVCHEMHRPNSNDTTKSIHFSDATERVNKSFLRANVDKYVPDAATPAVLHTDTPKREAGNANGDPVQDADTPDRAVEGGDASTARGYCQVCHTQTNYHRSTADAPPPSQGDAQCHDGEANSSCGPAETHCGNCHEHNNNFAGVGGSVTCLECHDSIKSEGTLSRRIITTEFDLLSSHIKGGSAVATQPDCQVCHDFGTHKGQFVTVFDVDDGTTTYAQATAEVSALAPAEGAAMSPHCFSCHADGSAASLPGSGDQTPSSPFTGSAAAPVINAGDASLWTSAGHNRPGTAPVLGCVGCHRGHGSDELSLLAPITSEPGVVADASAFCMGCHKASGYSSKDVRSEFDPAVVGTGWQTTSGSGADVNQRHDIFDADQTYSEGSVACADCHSQHADNATSPVQNPDTGNALANYNPANYGGGLDPTFGATEPDMVEFCTACHSEDKDPGTTTIWEGAGQSVMSTDLLQIGGAGGTYESDFHGEGFGGSGGNGFLKAPWVVDTAYASLQCTTCHGAHGSPNIFNLRSSITVGEGTASETIMETGGWSTGKAGDIGFKVTTTYDLGDANGGVQEDHQWGAFCSFCHQMEAHGMTETKTCNGGHMHGGGKL